MRRIHEKWKKAPFIHLDPDCPKLILCEPEAIGPFCSIGGFGFGYYRDHKENTWREPKSHEYGLIILEGARLHPGVTIDRGSWRDTFIGKYARLNMGVSIGHNNRIGDDCLINMGVSISGSCNIGNRVIIWRSNHRRKLSCKKWNAHKITGSMVGKSC
jgi:acetyltransferase-like isoleucine patch superfamily enzyme